MDHNDTTYHIIINKIIIHFESDDEVCICCFLVPAILGLLSMVIPMIWAYTVFKQYGFPSIYPIPLAGNFWKSKLVKNFFVRDLQAAYDEYPDAKYIGVFGKFFPTFLLKDPEIIRRVCTEDRDHFASPDPMIITKEDFNSGKRLRTLRGEKWVTKKRILELAFTESKISRVTMFMAECARQMMNYLDLELDIAVEQGHSAAEVDIGEIYDSYNCNVIKTCAFTGLMANLEDRNDDYFDETKRQEKLSVMQYVRLVVLYLLMMPSNIAFNISEISIIKKITKFLKNKFKLGLFCRQVNETLTSVAVYGTPKPKGKSEILSEQEKNNLDEALTGAILNKHGMVFCIIGFDNGSKMMSNLLLELALNKNVQQKMQKEIDEYVEKFGFNVPYEIIQNMKYLDMVMIEACRKWPCNALEVRVCKKNYLLPPAVEKFKACELRKGKPLLIPIYALHHDPKYWQDPKKFDPERFSGDQNLRINFETLDKFASKISTDAIGFNFSEMECKILLFYLLQKYSLEANEKTPPMVDLQDITVFDIIKGRKILLNIVKRSQKKSVFIKAQG